MLILRRLRRCWLLLRLGRDAELQRCRARTNVAALNIGPARLVVVDAVRVDDARDEVAPVLVALLDDGCRKGGVLVRLADDGDNVAAAGDFVVGEPVAEDLDGAWAVFLDVEVVCGALDRLPERGWLGDLLSTRGAMGSLTSMASIFQSVSPPSLGARPPRSFTCLTCPT